MARGIQLPELERLALAELAERRGKSENAVLQDLIRDAVKRDLTAGPTKPDKGENRGAPR